MSDHSQERSRQQLLRRIPKVDRVAGHGRLEQARLKLGPAAVTRLARTAIDEIRTEVLTSGVTPLGVDALAECLAARVDDLLGRRAQRVINASGVVVHTNLGRAPLSEPAVAALAATAGGYSCIELDLATGRRGRRAAFVETALGWLSGAEDALVVNNNAAAVLLALTALAAGRSVVLSRGELVEIGGGFRIPEVLARSGARMIEVGTTNCTHLADYERALGQEPDAVALLRVHQSNFRQIGFVKRPDLGAMAALARERGVLLIEDLGGGALLDLAPHGLEGEPTVQASVAAGCDLVCFSGDKVLGGPQAGVLVGRAELIRKIRRDPLARAVRLGRLPMVALEATLQSYLAGELQQIPVLHMLRGPLEAVAERAAGWQRWLAGRGVACHAVEHRAAVGGGALAERPVPSVALALATAAPSELAARLRAGRPPVLCRVADDQLLLDARTVLPGEDEQLLEAVLAACLGPG